MNLPRDLYINLELHDCVNWNHQEELKAVLETLILHENLLPLLKKRVRLSEGVLANLVATDSEKWFHDNYYYRENWDDNEFNTLSPSERFIALFRTTLRKEWNSQEPLVDAINFSINANRYGDQYNFILIATTLFNVSDYLADPEKKSLVNEIPQLLARLAVPISQALSPSYGAITHKRYLKTYGHEVLSAKLKYVHWFNLFGPRYVKKLGKQFLLDTPVWKVKELNNETTILQLAPDFIESHRYTNMEEEILQYLKPVGVKEITWP